MRATTWVVVLSALCGTWIARTAGAQPAIASGETVSDLVDRYITGSMARQHIPGHSLVVIRNGETIKAKGYGLASLELQAPAKPDTVYELASATKPFVATAIMLLVQDGKIDLDDEISKHLEKPPETWRKVTIRHLLTHTSGIKDYLGDLRHDFPHHTSLEDFVQAVAREPLNFPPGKKWTYSNTGYVLLGAIVRRQSGETYDKYLWERAFKPLDMSATRRDSADEIISGRATGYLWSGSGGLRNADYLKFLMMNHGDRGIVSTVLDLAKWDRAIDTDRLLSATSREAMWRPVTLNDGSSYDYGCGWFLGKSNGHRHIYHPGGAPGSASIISRYPGDRLTVILLTNGGAAYPQALDLGVAQRYVPDLVSRNVVRLNTELLDSYTGYYNAYGTQVLRMTRENEALVADDGGRLTNLFLPISNTAFVAEDSDREFTLSTDARGDVSGMVLRLGPDQMKVQRIGPLFGSLKRQPDPDRKLTNLVEAVMKAMAEGGKAVESAATIAAQARRDFSHGRVPEFVGLQSISFVHSQDVSERGIERHGAKVSRVVYYRISTTNGPHSVLIYMTAEGQVNDEDVLAE